MRTYSTSFAILEARVGTPSDPLVTRQDPGSLSFEEEKALGECGAIVVGGKGEGDDETEEKKQGSHGNVLLHHFGEIMDV